MTNLLSKTVVSAAEMCLVVFWGLAVLGCNINQTTAPPDTRAADEAAVRKADADWAAAAQTKQVDAWVAFYSDDAVVLPPNDNAATTKDGIRKVVAGLFALPSLSVNWQTAKVETARSGELAYTHGTYQLSYKDPKGKSVEDHGKYVEVWKKQADGSWKCAADTWNSDLPAPPASK